MRDAGVFLAACNVCAALSVGCAYAFAALTLAHLAESLLVLGAIVVISLGRASRERCGGK